MATLALSPVTAAVNALLVADATLVALTPRIWDEVRQLVAESLYPFVWHEVRERDVRGFGTGTLPEVELRVHVFSRAQGPKEAQGILDRVIVLLKDQPLTISGFNHCGRVFYDETVLLPDEDVNGIKVRELVALFRVYAEKTA